MTLMDFFTSDIKDYAQLHNQNEIIKRSPKVTHKIALSSELETIVYLHKGFGQRQTAGAPLLSLSDGNVSVRFIHPNTAETSIFRNRIENSILMLSLPEFYENLVISIKGINR